MPKAQKKPKLYKNNSAFTLFELTIIFTIIGILLIPALSFTSKSKKAARIIETKKELKTIYHALVLFYHNNHRLPFPADIAIANPADNNYNIEDDSPNLTCASGDVEYGAIPTATLDIENTNIADSWGNKYSYYVRSNLTATEAEGFTIANGAIREDTNNNIHIHDHNFAIDGQDFAFVVISHGEDGRGAYPKNSDATTISVNPTDDATTEEQRNILSIGDCINGEEIYISDGAIEDISIGATGFDILNDSTGFN